MLTGLTGQTGAGKSQVSAMLRERGFDVIDADLTSRQVTQPGSACLAELADTFGGGILRQDGSFDRGRMGGIVFGNAEKLRQLEAIIFPHIMRAIRGEASRLREGSRGIFLDAPTLFESGADKDCEKIVSVIAPLELRLRRILARDGLTEEAAARRISSQQEDAFYASRSDFVIVNDGGLQLLAARVDEMVAFLFGG
jgi:dephospho-CoA kinase